MIDDNITVELAQQIAELKGITVSGFHEVTRRQDIANGRTAKIELRVDKLEKKEATNDGVKKGVRLSWGFIVTTVTLLATFITGIYYLQDILKR